MKVLYVDRDFLNADEDGSIIRSKFLYKTLRKFFDVHLLIVDDTVQNLSVYEDIPTLTVKPLTSSFLYPSNVYELSQIDQEKVISFISENSIKLVLFRFYIHWSIYQLVKSKLKCIFDVDLLFSRLSLSSFGLNTIIKNRYYLFEYLRFKLFELRLFRTKAVFLFSNYNESPTDEPQFKSLSNVIPQKRIHVFQKTGNLLFYGNLSATINKYGFVFFYKYIYKKIEKYLQTNNLYIDVVGRGDLTFYKDLLQSQSSHRFKFIGEVEDLDFFICNSRCVIFPILNFSGTLTRVLETVSLNDNFVCTSNVADSFLFSNQISSSNNPSKFAKLIIDKCDNPSTFSHFEDTKAEYTECSLMTKLKVIMENIL